MDRAELLFQQFVVQGIPARVLHEIRQKTLEHLVVGWSGNSVVVNFAHLEVDKIARRVNFSGGRMDGLSPEDWLIVHKKICLKRSILSLETFLQ